MAGFGPTDPAHYNDDYLRERGSNDTDSADGSLTFNFARIHKIATLAAGAHGMAGHLRHGSLLPERSAGEEPSMERIDEAWEIERRESLRKMSSCAVPPAAAAAAVGRLWLAPAPAAPPAPAPAPAPVPPRMARAATTVENVPAAPRQRPRRRARCQPRRRRAPTDPPHPRRRSRRRHTSTWRRRTRRRRCRCAAS